MENLGINHATETSPHKTFFGENQNFIKHLRTYGEVGIMNNMGNKIKSKLENTGKKEYFLDMQKNIQEISTKCKTCLQAESISQGI